MVLLAEGHLELPRLAERRLDQALHALFRDNAHSDELRVTPLPRAHRRDAPSLRRQVGPDDLVLRHHAVHARRAHLRLVHQQRAQRALVVGQRLDRLRVERDAAGRVGGRRVQLTPDQQGAQRRVDGVLQLQQCPEDR